MYVLLFILTDKYNKNFTRNCEKKAFSFSGELSTICVLVEIKTVKIF